MHLGIGQQIEALNWIDRALLLNKTNEEYMAEKALILWEVRGLESGLQFLNESRLKYPGSAELNMTAASMLREMHQGYVNSCMRSMTKL